MDNAQIQAPPEKGSSLEYGAHNRELRIMRALRGVKAEEARIGAALPQSVAVATSKASAPPLLLAETWNEEIDPTGWLVSEKLDGVRCYWDGQRLLARSGLRYFAPAWFTAGLPLEPLDGELWIGRKKFQRTVSIVRRQGETDLWQEVRFVMFDAPGEDGDFESRLEFLRLVMEVCQPAYAVAHPHILCEGKAHLEVELDRIESLGGEGLMLRRPGSHYDVGRSSALLKAKRFLDGEGHVVGHEPGKGRHKGRVGALLVRMASGARFAVGTGLTDSERSNPPVAGTIIRFKYQELSEAGVPRFPSYRGVREDV
jgi:DNA ligase-1